MKLPNYQSLDCQMFCHPPHIRAGRQEHIFIDCKISVFEMITYLMNSQFKKYQTTTVPAEIAGAVVQISPEGMGSKQDGAIKTSCKIRRNGRPVQAFH
ncbi:hypothetical protein P364_0109885 [Paenibacillus sp. MAEPY2]|nr:hypothetical protein P363_0126020 [Paenibacillus sp. MAEPY1]KGP83177.1 hypothetical protein P364_0109885 [Paenibacillus sp. MAEPY2]